MKKPLVTIFTPNYNGAKYIKETIESVLSQTYSHFEYIIIDDASTDTSWDIITSYAKKDSRIKPFRNKTNLGITKTRNKGFSKTNPKTVYFAIIDSDDIMLKKRIKTQVSFLEKHTSYELVGSDLELINADSEKVGTRVYPKSYQSICKEMLVRNPIGQSSVMLKFKEHLHYDESFEVTEDYNLWCEIASKEKVANLKALTKYRIHETQTVNKKLKKHLLAVIRIQKHWIVEPKFDNLRARIQMVLFKIVKVLPQQVLQYLK